MSKNVIVIGMARSGTSLAASIFARRGYHVGSIELGHMREGDDHNPFGYFEADALVNANVEIFRRVGYSYLNSWAEECPIPVVSAARIGQLTHEESHRRVVEHFNRRAPWVWKDPRLCYTLSYWWKLMDPARTGVLLVRRDPVEIYRSFQRMGWCSSDDAESRDRVLASIAEHMGTAQRAIVSLAIPHLEVDYADYRANPTDVARRLSEFFDLELSVEDLNFHPELNHSTFRGRIAASLRGQLRKLPRRPIRQLERLIPRRVLSLIFPERRYTDDRAALSRVNGR